MKRSEKDIDQILKRYMPPPSPEERKAALAAHKRVLGELRAELDELKSELDARRRNHPRIDEWPGELEPVVLAAAFLCRNTPEFDAIVGRVNQLSASPTTKSGIRFALFRLVRRGFLVEVKRKFQLTPKGEHALSRAKESARKWLDALGEPPGNQRG